MPSAANSAAPAADSIFTRNSMPAISVSTGYTTPNKALEYFIQCLRCY